MDAAITIIKDEMKSRGLSMTAMAQLIGCGRPYLYRVLSGEQAPTMEWIENAMNKLGIRIEINFEKSA